MGSVIVNDPFFKDKTKFFGSIKTLENQPLKVDIDSNISIIDTHDNNKDYSFLINNKVSLETEFKTLFAVLRKEKEQNNEAFWLYCYYCASLLESFYKTYWQTAKAAEYEDFKAQIKQRLQNEQDQKTEKESEKNFIESLLKSFTEGFTNLVTAPRHISKIRDYVAYSNLCRLYWVFCRLTLIKGLTLAKELQILEQLDVILGTQTDVDKIISALQAPNGVLNYFSVGFFLMKLMIDGALLVKHVCFPAKDRREDQSTFYERLKFELYKNHCNNANDLVWGVVNFLTNFNHITHISGPAAGAITAVFLGFDICLLLYQAHLAKQEYLMKKEQYVEEFKYYSDPARSPNISEKDREAHKIMLQKQLDELKIKWQATDSKLYFCAAAAALLMLGFSAALIFSGPGIIAASYFVCLVAVAMYFSSDSFAKYKECSLRLNQEETKLGSNNLAVIRKEYEAARNDFIFNMLKNTVVPTLLIATFAICWPAAIALTVIYVGYEIFHSFSQHKDSQEVKRLELECSRPCFP